MQVSNSIKAFGVATVVALALATVSGPALAGVPLVRIPSVASLPAPYAEWNVDLAPVEPDEPRVLTLSFDSPLLGRRVSNSVYLPTGYREDSASYPVLYALHGTVFPPLDNCALNLATRLEAFVQMISCGGGGLQDQLYDIPTQVDAMRFLVVAPDTDLANSICETCLWIDGHDDVIPNVQPLTAETLPADSFLHGELYPLVESLFATRTDRGGRGVIGFSMGGWAAAVQGMLHPDKYAYIGWNSGVYQLFEPDLLALANGVGYLRDQGYGTSVTHEIWWRQFNPADIIRNISGTNIRIFLSNGDACLGVGSLNSPDCQGPFSPVAVPSGAALEAMLHRNWMIATSDLRDKEIPHVSVELPGIHGSSNHRAFSEYLVPGANETFASTVAAPETFAYSSVFPHFSVWGYEVTVTRPDDEFLALSGARTDGRSLTVAGSGLLDLLTPPAFVRGRTYDVVTSGGGPESSAPAVADDSGRLHLSIDLGRGQLLSGVLNDLGLSSSARSTAVRIEG
jgi:putative esterase